MLIFINNLKISAFFLQNLLSGQRVLVEQGAKGGIELGELPPEGHGALEEGFYGNGPKFLVAGGGIGVEEVGLAGLHAFEDGPGDGGKLMKIVVKGFIAAFLDRKIDIGKRVCHFVKPNVLAIRIIGELLHKMVPG